MTAISETYLNALSKTMKQPTRELRELKNHWPEIEKNILSQREKLRRRIKSDDPIQIRINLLSPIERVLDETIHTRALAYLLTSSEQHGFGKAVLEALLEKLPWGSGARRILALLRQKHVRVEVMPEYHFPIEGSRKRSAARCDIRIELHTRNRAALIILENKIEAPEGDGQLAWYKREADKWRKRNKKSRLTLLIYLAREERDKKDSWHYLSYLNLASALRSVWQNPQHRRKPGSAWLKLYIATITNSVLGLDINHLSAEDIKIYLGES